MPLENTFVLILAFIAHGVPALDNIETDVNALFFQLKSSSNPPLAHTPLNSPLYHSEGNAGKSSMYPS